MAQNDKAIAEAAKRVTVKGRLSFPRFKHAEAVAFAAQSQFDSKKDPSEISSSFALLLEQDQVDKIVAHVRDKYLPFAKAQNAVGEKRDGKLDPKYIDKILKFMEAGDWSDAPPNFPIKAINPKYQDQTPECVARLEIKGPKGGDVLLKARVEDETQLVVPDPDLVTFPVVKPIEQTAFQMYPGAYVAATLNLYSYFSSNAIYGIGAGANTAVYLGNLHGEKLGGGGNDVNDDDVFDL